MYLQNTQGPSSWMVCSSSTDGESRKRESSASCSIKNLSRDWFASSIVSLSLYLSATVSVWIYQSELLCVYTLYIWFGNWASNLAARFHCVTTRLFLILNQGPAVLLVLDPRNIPIGRWFWLIVWLIIIRLLTSTEIS